MTKEQLKAIRLNRGFTQKEFAESIGYAHKNSINYMERGRWGIPKVLDLLLAKELKELGD